MREYERLSDGRIQKFDAEAAIAKARADRDADAILISAADVERIRQEAGG